MMDNTTQRQLGREPRSRAICADQFGMGIIEVLVAVSMLSAVSMGMIILFQSQQAQIRALVQKQDSITLKNMMLQQLANPNVCTWQLKDKVIDVSMATTAAAPSPSELVFTT